MSDNNDPAQDDPSGISPRPPTLSSPPQMPPPSYDNTISSSTNRGDRIERFVDDLDIMNNNSFLRTAEADLAQLQQIGSQKLTPAEMFLNDNENMPLGTSIVVRNADMARLDPYTDFRRLSKSQAEATGLFDSFSSRARALSCSRSETEARYTFRRGSRNIYKYHFKSKFGRCYERTRKYYSRRPQNTER